MLKDVKSLSKCEVMFLMVVTCWVGLSWISWQKAGDNEIRNFKYGTDFDNNGKKDLL